MANNSSDNQRSQRTKALRIAGVILLCLAVVTTFLWIRPKRLSITVTHAQRQAITSTVITNGKVEPEHNFEAHAPEPAAVRKVYVHEGDRVRRGQLLIQLDDADARAQLAKTEAGLKAAESAQQSILVGGTKEETINHKSAVERAGIEKNAAERNLLALEGLQKQGAASQQEVDAARDRSNRAKSELAQLTEQSGSRRYSNEDRQHAAADLAQARAEVRAAEQSVNDSNLRAPFDGTVYNVAVKDSSFVSQGDLLLQLADLSSMQVRAFVDEPDIARLAPGQKVQISWDARPQQQWAAVVGQLPLTIVSHGNRMVGELLCSVAPGQQNLLPNTNVNVSIVTAEKPAALTVPRGAVHIEGGHSYVYVVVDMHLKRQEVTTGIFNLTSAEILSGLDESSILAIDSLSLNPLKDGAMVRIVENPS